VTLLQHPVRERAMSLLMEILMSPSGLAFDRALVRWTGESPQNRVVAAAARSARPCCRGSASTAS